MACFICGQIKWNEISEGLNLQWIGMGFWKAAWRETAWLSSLSNVETVLAYEPPNEW